jgi:peptide/nickel transport system ATP-binding protein
VAQLATRVAVMQAGKFVEMGEAEEVLTRPEHPYTQALLAAVPEIPA